MTITPSSDVQISVPSFDRLSSFDLMCDDSLIHNINVSDPVVLSVLDLQVITDTLNASTAIVDNGHLFQFSAEARRETMKRVLGIMNSVAIQIVAR